MPQTRVATRRFFALGAGSLLLAAAVGNAQAWSFSFGGGERVKGSGEVIAEPRNLGSFDAISLSGNFKLLVRQAASEAIEVKADRNLLPHIETRIVENNKGRTLEVGIKRGYQLSPTVTPTLSIAMPALRAVAVAGSGDIKVETMKTPQLDVSIAGSGDVLLADMQAERVGFKVSGSGDIVAHGRAAQVGVSIAGSGDVKVATLEADEVKVSIAGSGDAQVHANKQLKVSIAGSGDVRYKGAPEISSSVAGSGSVRKLGD